MQEVFMDAIMDSIKIIPILFLTYILIEFYEHHLNDKQRVKLISWRHFGPLAGAVIGCVPQCGFSVMAASLFAKRTISAGTLIAVFISTSDEALPILISHPEEFQTLVGVLLVKVIIAIIAGYVIDAIFPSKLNSSSEFDHSISCSCEEHDNIFISSIRHTFHTFGFILLINIALSFIIDGVGTKQISSILMSGSMIQPFAAALIGLIPNCAASILLVQLYLVGAIPFASLTAGLVSSAGLGLLMLFKVNKNLKENLLLLILLYVIAAASGLIFLWW